MSWLFKVGVIVNREKWGILGCNSSFGRCLQSTHTAELVSRIPSLKKGNIAAKIANIDRTIQFLINKLV